MKKPIVIFGAGGFAREVLQVILDLNAQSPKSPPWEPLGFIVDPTYAGKNLVHGLPILGGVDWLAENPQTSIVIAVGSSAARLQIAQRIEAACQNPFASLVHPRAWIGRQVAIGHGSVVCAGCMITTDIQIGRHVHVNIGSTVGHDASLRDFVTINPGVNISGNVTLNEGAEIGTGSVLIPGTTVGEWSIVGASSVVTKSLDPNVTAVGVPARVIKFRPAGWQMSPSP